MFGVVNIMYYMIKFVMKLQALYHYAFIQTYREIYFERIISVEAIHLGLLKKKRIYCVGWFEHLNNVVGWILRRKNYIPPTTFINYNIPEADFYQVSFWNGKKRIIRSGGCGYIRVNGSISDVNSKKLLHASIGGKDVTNFVNSYEMTFTKFNKITAKELFMMAIIFQQIPRLWHGPVETEIIMCDEIIKTSWLKDSDIVYLYGDNLE